MNISKRLEERILKNSAVLEQMAKQLAALDAKLEGLDHIIRGNGSPGLSSRVNTLETTEKNRSKEWHKFEVLGLSVLTAVISSLLPVLVQRLRG